MDFKKITIYCSDPDKQLTKMLNKIGSLANPGHSFDAVLDPDDSENRSTFYFDGDGSFNIKGIHEEDVDLEEVKKNSTKMQTKDGTKMVKKYNPMTMMMEEDRSRVKDANEFTSKGYKLELNQIRAINNLADNGFSTIAIIKDSTGKVIKRSGISGWTEAAVEKKAVAWFDEFIKGVSKAKDSNFTSKVLALGDRAIKFANNATENKLSSSGYKGNKNQAYKLLDEIDTLVAAEDARGNIEAKRMGERASKFRNSVDKIFKGKTKDASENKYLISWIDKKGVHHNGTFYGNNVKSVRKDFEAMTANVKKIVDIYLLDQETKAKDANPSDDYIYFMSIPEIGETAVGPKKTIEKHVKFWEREVKDLIDRLGIKGTIIFRKATTNEIKDYRKDFPYTGREGLKKIKAKK